jgi:hypothetical protein
MTDTDTADTESRPDMSGAVTELVRLYARWPNIRPEIDMAIVGLVRSGWSQVSLATEFGVLGQEISRRVNRCGDCEPGPDDLTDDPARLWALYNEAESVPRRIDELMSDLVDAGWRFHEVGALVGVSKQMVSKRVARHRAGGVDDDG